MRQRGIIQSVLNKHEYISPYSGPWCERIDDHIELDKLVNKIIEENTQQEVDIEDEEDQLYVEPLPPVTYSEALQALYVLKRYEEEYRYSDEALLKASRSFERV